MHEHAFELHACIQIVCTRKMSQSSGPRLAAQLYKPGHGIREEVLLVHHSLAAVLYRVQRGSNLPFVANKVSGRY
jgi:hypothetical protein